MKPEELKNEEFTIKYCALNFWFIYSDTAWDWE